MSINAGKDSMGILKLLGACLEPNRKMANQY
jgi:hypothetical protein